MLIGKIEIQLHVDGDGDLVHTCETSDSQGNDLPMIEALGMIEMAKDSILRDPHLDDEKDEG